MSTPLYAYLKNGSSIEMNVDGTTPVEFTFTPTASCKIQRVNFVIVDGTIKYGQFLGIASALTNGLLIEHRTKADATITNYTADAPIKTTEDFGALSGVDAAVSLGVGDDSFPVRWTLANAGSPLFMEAGEDFCVTVRDNISALSKFRAQVQGFYI